MFASRPLVKELMERTRTKTGLWVTVDLLPGNYPAGEKAPAGFKKTMKIVFDDLLPKWNYLVLPQEAATDSRGNQ
jgi:hypothetical protein